MLKRTMTQMGEDWLITVEGGKSHIGSVILAQPYTKDGQVHVTLNILNRLSHKDDVIGTYYAKALCEAVNQAVVCVCGIHYDDFNAEKYEQIQNWVDNDIPAMLEEIQKQKQNQI